MFLNGELGSLAERMGAHVQDDGRTRYRVWAPNAAEVALVVGGEGDEHEPLPMERAEDGVWELVADDAPPGTPYRFAVTSGAGQTQLKADPMARQAAPRPSACSLVTASAHRWGDVTWMAQRASADLRDAPLSIYEVHLGTWRRDRDDPGVERPYTELADELAAHVLRLGFTHVELMPLTAHPYPGSWGYQTTSYFAPDWRHGSPDDLRLLIDTLHQRGIGVILDWAPGHFAPDDWALARFDGTPTYEHADPRRGTQPAWGSLVFDYGKPEVRAFLLASARYWLTEFHIDGLRIDAVASMLRHDWGRSPDQVLPNDDGSLDHHEAIGFLRELTSMVPQVAPGAITIAEEASGHPGVTADDGLGFSFSWNMGWTADWLGHVARPPAERPPHHNDITFASSYAGAERYVLGISHDDVSGTSLVERVWGEPDEQLAGLRALLALQWAHRGKKLLFMGCEFAQRRPWSHHRGLDWDQKDEGVLRLVAALGERYCADPALWSLDTDEAGMQWIAADDRDRSTYAFARHGRGGELLVCVANLGSAPQPGYRVSTAALAPILDTDDARFGGGGSTQVAISDAGTFVDLPPLSCVWLAPPEPADA